MADNSKKKFSVRKLIYNDKYLIIISIVIAIIFWCVTSMSLSPETNKTISVPITVDFTDTAASQLGIKCYGAENVDVDVTISCKKYLAKDITADDINAYIQANTVTTTGNKEVPIKVEGRENGDFKVVSYYPTVYKAYFDVEEEKVMDIDVSYENKDFIEEGYVMGEALLSENNVTVKGPKSYVTTVDKVVSNIKFDEKIKETQTFDLKMNAVDSSGNAVDYVSIVSKNENVSLTIPVLKRTTLDVTSSYIGNPPKVNLSDFSISYSVNSVHAGVLEEADIKQANIGNIDFSHLTVGENEFVFDTNKMESFAVLDNINEIKATVTVPDTYKTTTLYVDGSNVEFSNLPNGYKAEIASLNSYSVTAVGLEDDLKGLTSSNVKLLIDMSSIKKKPKEGVSTFNITATLENNDTCWVYGEYKASVRVYKK